mmetsp:Transcript_4124/g.11640  ORF Transcript_4124/g.11640 Transcript_4124/m.11640 type:complete len:206 (-) Transcript_4124:927-1544(-)
MARCPPTRLLEVAMMPSTPSSPRLVPASMCPVPSSLTWSLPSSTRSAPAPTVSCSTPSSSSPERRMPPTILPVATTPLARRLSTSSWTASASCPTTALGSRASLSSMLLAAAPAPVSALSCWSACPSTTAKNPNSDSPSIPLPRFLPRWLSRTTRCCPPTLSWSTPTLPLCSTTRPCTTSAVALLTSSARPTPTLTVSLLRSSLP